MLASTTNRVGGSGYLRAVTTLFIVNVVAPTLIVEALLLAVRMGVLERYGNAKLAVFYSAVLLINAANIWYLFRAPKLNLLFGLAILLNILAFVLIQAMSFSELVYDIIQHPEIYLRLL